MSDEWTIGGRSTNALRVLFTHYTVTIDSNSSGPFEVRPSSISGSVPINPYERIDDRFQVTDNVSLFVPRGNGFHHLKAGANIGALPVTLKSGRFARGGFFFETDLPFDPATPTTFPSLGIVGSAFVTDRTSWQLGAYASDDWTISPRLTLNLGVRYEIETKALNEDVPNPVPYFDRPALDVNNWSPRLGLAYSIREGMVARAGYGRYAGHLFTWLSDGRQRPPTLRFTENPDYRGFRNPNGSDVSSAQSITGTDPRIEVPQNDEFSVGIDRQLLHEWAVAIDYVGMRGHDEVLEVETNAPDAVTGRRPHPEFGPVPAFASIGRSDYDGLQVSLRSRDRGRYSFGIAYSLSRSRNDHNYYWDVIPGDTTLAGDYGPALNDQRHRLVLNGTSRLPWRFSASGILTLGTAQPFNINSGVADEEGVFQRPLGVGRNAGRGDSYSRLDLRLWRTFAVKAAKIEAIAEIYNLFNTTNADPDTIVQNILSPQFGSGGSTPHPLYIARQAQVGMRVTF